MLPESGLLVLAAAILTALATAPLRRFLLARKVLDWPDQRRSHAHPTPRGGGLAMVLGVFLVLGLPVLWADVSLFPLLFLGVLSLLGWLDDLYQVPIGLRLLVMLGCALSLVWGLGPITAIDALDQSWRFPWLWSALGVIAVVWLINLHNFMDGSDGLAALQGLWSAALLGALLCASQACALGLVGMAVAGACLGFLLWNRPPARIFMGDSGSLMLGGAIGLLAYGGAATGLVSIWLSLIVCALFVVDATATLLRRGFLEGQWYTPHRDHAYQKLIRLGWGHGQVLALYGALNLLVVGPALILALNQPDWAWAIALTLVMLLGTAWFVVQNRCP
ncbi:MAG: MraY family glycosyltransferase [Wenzhouxiangella sp.]